MDLNKGWVEINVISFLLQEKASHTLWTLLTNKTFCFLYNAGALIVQCTDKIGDDVHRNSKNLEPSSNATLVLSQYTPYINELRT